MSSILPWYYYYFFAVLEPSLSLIGAGYAIFMPEKYADDLLPRGVERLTDTLGGTIRGQMVVMALGSCFFLLALISYIFFPLIRKQLQHQPAIQEKFVSALLTPLAICDLIHIFVTLIPLPVSLITSPSRWTATINGNVVITIVLFIVRVLWFAGAGRGSAKIVPAKKRR